MWSDTKIESVTRKKLEEQFGPHKGIEWFSKYVTTRQKLVEDVLPEIKAMEPDLSDHGPRHIANVLDNAGKLLGLDQGDVCGLSGLELYCLITAILFHDTGNIYGRDGHNKKVSKIYDYIHSDNQRNPQEKSIIIQATQAHTGKGADGTSDTLKDLDNQAHLEGEKIRLCDLATILRFADELAEGAQRTSLFMQQEGLIEPGNMIYHKYANIVKVFIDRPGSRIALTYHLEISSDSGTLAPTKEQELRELLDKTFDRIRKLNTERKYAKYYSTFLEPFKEVSVSFCFWIDGERCTFSLPSVSLSDKVIPSERGIDFVQTYGDYSLDNLISKVKSQIASGGA